ncbi:MAG: hypothetical protein HOQ24_18605 [Mycobacteriaceae bacterium]|nr:hypothetical protein [Mycobacteriaceae bacterium]
MTFWIVALVVWVAAGARIGRVLVRPASTVRTAIIVAVAAVAAASTVAIPHVAQAIDSTAQLRVRDPLLSDAQAVAAWVVFTAASAVVAFAAWPVTSRRNLLRVAAGVYLAGIVFAVVSVVVSPTLGWIVVAAGALFIGLAGLRSLAWNPLGRGILTYALGAMLIAGLAAVQVRRSIADGPVAARHPAPDWAWSGAAVFLAVGAMSILIEVWFRARILLRRIRSLHGVLVERFPEVVMDRPARTAPLRASDQVAQVMDAMYLQAGGGALSGGGGPLPAHSAERAATVAEWVHDPTTRPLDLRWIAPPDGVSARRWVSAIAKEFAHTA